MLLLLLVIISSVRVIGIILSFLLILPTVHEFVGHDLEKKSKTLCPCQKLTYMLLVLQLMRQLLSYLPPFTFALLFFPLSLLLVQKGPSASVAQAFIILQNFNWYFDVS